jgi:hypothetical protein
VLDSRFSGAYLSCQATLTGIPVLTTYCQSLSPALRRYYRISALPCLLFVVAVFAHEWITRQVGVAIALRYAFALLPALLMAWMFALSRPQMTENLIILNLPHPKGLLRELRTNQEQIKNSEYARVFQTRTPSDPTVFFGLPMTAETLSSWVRDTQARKHYVEAFQRSDFTAMLNYYKRNYPKAGLDAPPIPDIPKVKMPVLMFHGLGDTALHSDALSGTWNWLEKDLTLVTVPGAGHFVQQDAAELVTSTMKWWLTMRTAH